MIAIIGAMESEVQHLVSKIHDVHKTSKAGRDFFMGKMEDKDVVVVKSGIGKVNAAITTTILNEEFTPKLIINTGIVGGVKGVASGDVLLIDKVVYHDVSVTVFGYDYGQVPGLSTFFELDIKEIEKMAQLNRFEALNLQKGTLATGDTFLTKGDIFKEQKTLSNVNVVDMEGAAIAHCASLYNVPLLMVKKVSDILDMPNQVDDYIEFEKKAALEVSVLVGKIINTLQI